MNKTWLIIWALIMIVGATLRFASFTSRAPFDWDQNRDYQKVSAIVSGKLTMLGPVAKGDSGFYLGPLYYYLLVPGFLLSGGSPSSFPVTSMIIDLLCLASLIYVAYRRPSHRLVVTLLGIIWACSWYAIESSRISWNVALLPLWITWMYNLGTTLRYTSTRMLAYGLVAGLSWHIHASLLPLSLLLPLFFAPRHTSRLAQLLYFGLGYLIALSPLIFFDLRHAFFNFRLMTNFVDVQKELSNQGISSIVVDVLSKIGKNVQGLLGAPMRSNILLGVFVVVTSLGAVLSRRRTLVWLGVVNLTIFLLVIALRDIRFPEYYLAASHLPTLALFLVMVQRLPLRKLALPLAMLLTLYLSLTSYTQDATPYSLQHKIDLVKEVVQLGVAVDARYELSPGREGGLVPLLSASGVDVTESAITKIVFTDKLEGPVVIGDELATPLAQFGGLRVVIHKLQ